MTTVTLTPQNIADIRRRVVQGAHCTPEEARRRNAENMAKVDAIAAKWARRGWLRDLKVEVS